MQFHILILCYEELEVPDMKIRVMGHQKFGIIPLFIFVLVCNFVTPNDSRSSSFNGSTGKFWQTTPEISHHVKENLHVPLESMKDNVYGDPLTLPPVESLPPIPLPENSPPFLMNPAPLPPTRSYAPSKAPDTPNFPFQNPPPSPPNNNFAKPPQYDHEPPPPPYQYGSNPPKRSPSPPVNPPPSPVAQVPHKKPPQYAVWCVAKPTIPDSMLQEALDYACGTGADCKAIQVNGQCFQPNTVLSHASYAFNSYWQTRKIGGGTCDFGGTAMLVTVDPSYDNCNFVFK